MKVLILIAHGDLDGKSNAHLLASSAEESLKANGHEVRVVDLVKKGFDRSASASDLKKLSGAKRIFYVNEAADENNLQETVREQQANIRWCTHVIVCAPIWFHSLPSSFFAYFERVFTKNFSFDDVHNLDNGPFKDKKVMFAVTAGAPEIYYSRASHFPLEATLFPVTIGHFHYCGFQILRTQGFFSVFSEAKDDMVYITPDKIEKWKKAVLNMDKRPVLTIQGRGHTESDIEQYARLPNYTLEEAIAAK